MIILITGMFPTYDHKGWPTGKKEFMVSHGVNEATGEIVITPNDSPQSMGAEYDEDYCEWIIYDR